MANNVKPDIGQLELNHPPPECSTVITVNSGVLHQLVHTLHQEELVAVSLWQSWWKQPKRPGLQLQERLNIS